MRFNKFFMGIMGALALSACSSEEVMPDQKPDGEGEPRFMTVAIRNTNQNTRAGGDQATDPDGNIFEEGYDSENNIKSLRFYFFDGNGAPIAIQTNGRNFYETDEIENTGTSDMPNVEKVLNAVIVINSTDNEIGSKIKKMVAVANYKSIETKLGSDNLSLSGLQAIVGSEVELNVAADPATGFVMTSSSFVDGNGNPCCAAAITEANIRQSREEALNYPVDVYVERVVAKVRVKADWDNTIKVLPGVKYDGKTYTAIALTSKLADGTTTKKITVDNTEGGEQVYAIFRNWDLWWTADNSYLIKKVDNWAQQLGDWWNHYSYHRSYWAENPAGVKLNKHPHNFASKNILASGSFSAANVANEAAYCLENAAKAKNNGLMGTYNPDNATTPRTLVYLSALLVTVDANKEAKPVELAEWASTRGTVGTIKASMFKVNENVVYLRSAKPISTNGGSTTDPDGNTVNVGTDTYKLYAVTADDLHFVSGLDAGMANDDVENSPRYLSYLVLNDNITREENGAPVELDTKFYQKVNGAVSELGDKEAANAIFKSVGGAKVWNTGNTYYYHEINHLGPSNVPAYEQKGYYGVVRNHIYEVALNNVYGLGTPVLTPEDLDDPDSWEDIIPQKPTNEFYLGARVNILSWRVVPNSVKLEW